MQVPTTEWDPGPRIVPSNAGLLHTLVTLIL